ncbi:endonuclease/exonuclease/phosphatase family protein [Nocardioides sp. MAHUQ-72]|uniref:endonuclease/exonuclease/phosphatase family protein n=1 Tax=unclassified Nocardioides TaxID=2615069 RepID=UPI003608F871
MIFRPRTPVVGTVCALLATLLGISLAPVLTTSATAAGGGQARVGSFNINASRSTAVFKNAVRHFRQSVDVAGLQEVTSKEKTAFLHSMRGWAAYGPDELHANPIIWRKSVFKGISGHGVKIASARNVGNEKPGAPAHRTPQYATVARLQNRATGVKISVINVHLVAGAVNGGRCVKDAPRLCELYKDSVAGLRRAAAQERSWANGRVYVIGDMNDNYPADKRHKRRPLAFAQLRSASLVAHWERRREILPSRGSGTRGGAYLDQIWARRKPARIDVDRSINVSDHYPIVAVYDVRATA